MKNYIGSLNKNEQYTLNYNDYLDPTNMGPDFFSNIELRNSLNIQSLSSTFEELKIFLDRIEKSGGYVSVLVLQKILDARKT